MAKSGYIYSNFTGDENYNYDKTYKFYIYWEVVSQNAISLTTNLYLSWGLNKVASNTVSVNTTGSAKLTAKYGTTTLQDSGSVYFDMRQDAVGNHRSLYNKTVTVQHDISGRCELNLYGYLDTDLTVGVSEIDEVIELPVIPTDSSITATDARIGSTSVVVVKHSYDSYSHSIAVSFGTLSGWISSDGQFVDYECIFSDTNIAFYIPDEFYLEIPDSQSGQAILTLTTYQDGSKISGDYKIAFKVSVDPLVCSPVANISTEDVDSNASYLSGGNSYIKNVSDVKCTYMTSGKYGSSVVSRKINGIAMETDGTLTFLDTQYESYSLLVVDSRGLSTTTTETVDTVNYFKPAVSLQAKRTDQTSGNVNLTVFGKCWFGDFGSVKNTLTVSYRYMQIGGEWSEYSVLREYPSSTETNDYSFTSIISGIDYRSVHYIEVLAQDLASSASVIVPVAKGTPLYDWGESDMRFHVPLDFDEEVKEETRANLGIIINEDGTTSVAGKDGVGIASVEQTTTSTEDGGVNIITITLTDDSAYAFTVRNGSRGSTGSGGAVYISLTVNPSSDVIYNSDREISEIYEAYQAGSALYCLAPFSGETKILSLREISDSTCVFSGVQEQTEYSATFISGSYTSFTLDTVQMSGAGEDGVGISSVEQTITSTVSGGRNVFTVTLTDGTTSDFTVRNGAKGETGENGKDGVDAIQINTAYIDDDGHLQLGFEDGHIIDCGQAQGEQGVSCTHSWDGTTLTVTSASGTSSADLKGDKGDKGDTGPTGGGNSTVGSADPPTYTVTAYAVGDFWFDSSAGSLYICTEVSTVGDSTVVYKPVWTKLI